MFFLSRNDVINKRKMFLGEMTHTISGASVPWQFIPVQQGKVPAVASSAPAPSWEMEKFNNILYQIWSEHTSRSQKF